MTPEQIAELEALAEKATPGPWEVEEDPTQDGDHATLVCLSGKFGTMGTWLLGCFHNWKEAARGERRISWKEAESNASLIVALRNNLPAILAALKAQQPDEAMVERVAIRDITGERERQITDEHWSPEHDDKHSGGEMAMAAACYAYGEIIDTQTGYCLWPWFEDWWKPADTRRNLVKAGALIVAEIERLDRAAIAAMQESRDD